MRIVVQYFFPCCHGQKIYFENIKNVHSRLFEEKLVSAAIAAPQGSVSKTTTFLETAWKLSSTLSNFIFLLRQLYP